MKRRITAIAAMAVQLCMVCSGALSVKAAGQTLIAEGENSFRTSITCSTQSASSLSGGSALVVHRSADSIPKRGVTLLYKVQSQYEGAYYMYITCPTIGAAWISPCEISINGDSYERLTSMKYEQVGTLNGTGVANDLYNQYKLKSVVLKKGVNDIYVRIPSARASDGQMYFYLDCIKFEPAPWEVSGFETGVPANIYEEKDEIAPKLNFSFSDSEPHTLYYRVEDYFGSTVSEETVDVRNMREYTLKFDTKPQTGHYTVHVSADGSEEETEYYFSVVKNYDERDVSANTHFMVDAAGIYLISTDKIEDYARAMRLAGMTSVRERFRWTTYQKSSDEIDMTAFEQYQKVYEENGLHTMTLNESVPAFMKNDAHTLFPADLVEAYKFSKFMSETYGTAVDVEAWNEPDAKQDGADYLAAYMKAMAIGQRDANPDNVAIGPGLCVSPSFYADTLFQNEAMEYLDVWAFHGHVMGANVKSNLCDIPKNLQLYMDTVKRYGYDGNKYYYLTEAGMSALPDPTVPAAQQKKQARYCATSMLETAAMGIDRHYWFVFPYYKEGDLWWGTFTSDDMPYSAYSVFAAMTDAVGEAKYIGSLDVGEDVTCYVFENRGKHVAAVWSENETPVKLPASQTEAELVNIMGVSRTIENSGGGFDITSGPDVQYIRLDGKFDAYKDVVYKEKQTERKEFTKAERVILQQNYPAESVAGVRNGGYMVDKSSPTTLNVDVTNLNDTVMSGTVSGTAYGGWKLSPDSQSVTVEPFSKATLTFELAPSAEVVAGVTCPVSFEGTFGGSKTSRCVASVVTPVGDDVETSFVLSGYDEPSNWSKNIAAGGTDEHVNEGNGVLGIRYTFRSGDKWVYPQFKLQNGDNLEGSSGLVYEAYFDTLPAGIRLRAFAYENNGSVYFTDTPVWVDGLKKGWNKIVIPWSLFVWQGGLTDFNFNLDPEEIFAISIGLNSQTETDISYKVRNLGVYSQPEVNVYANMTDIVCNTDGSSVSLSAELIPNETGIQEGSVKLVIDEKEVDVTLDGNSVTASFTASPGAHEGYLRFFDNTGKAIFKTCSFEIN